MVGVTFRARTSRNHIKWEGYVVPKVATEFFKPIISSIHGSVKKLNWAPGHTNYSSVSNGPALACYRLFLLYTTLILCCSSSRAKNSAVYSYCSLLLLLLLAINSTA